MLKWFLLLSSLYAVEIEVGRIPLEVEIADTERLRQIGLSGRTDLPEGNGMLFIYKEPQIACFWMKNTTIPLSVGFFDGNKTLIGWENMDPPSSEVKQLPIYKSKKPVMYALEVRQGWFERHGIKPGTNLKMIKNPSTDQENSLK